MEDILPYYLAIGVSKELFMDSCPVELKPYEKAHQIYLEQQNGMMHLQGLYIRSAFASAWSEKSKYPDKPYPLFGESKKENSGEGNEMLASAEWDGYSRALRRQGLQETEIKF